MSDSDVLKIHQKLGHCSEKKLADLVKFGGRKVGPLQIHRVAKNATVADVRTESPRL